MPESVDGFAPYLTSTPPTWRVQESTRVLRDLGATVTERVYPSMGHTINDDEIKQVTKLIAQLEQHEKVK
jgi:predicted esterase